MDNYSENFARCVRDNTNKQIEWIKNIGWTGQAMYNNPKGINEKITYNNIPVIAIDRCYRDYKMVHDIKLNVLVKQKHTHVLDIDNVF
jgi:hypothetical protein